jgi:hypothetical protein
MARSNLEIIFERNFLLRRMREGLAAAGIATAALLATSSPAEAQDVTPFGEVGAFIGWTWDLRGGGGFTWGIEGRGGVDFREQWACAAEPAFSAAGVGRVSFVGLDPQLHLGAQAGVAVSIFTAMGDITAGYRWGANPGFSMPVGLELQVFAGSTFFRFDPGLDSIAAGLGGFVPPREEIACAVAGRALHDEVGHAALPDIERLGETRLPHDLDPDVADALAMEWEARAKAEWASVPAFMQLADQLRIAGAPKRLVDRALSAADDELRHAIATSRAAMCYGGAPIGLGRVTPLTRAPARGKDALVRLAVESWVDGCQGEGTAARAAAREAELAGSRELRGLNERIARDEAGHAELAWDVLAWTVRAGGDDVRHAVDAVREATPAPSGAATERDLGRYGILGEPARADLGQELRERALPRLDALLG